MHNIHFVARVLFTVLMVCAFDGACMSSEKKAGIDISRKLFDLKPLHRQSPAWAKHFVAYVRGATGVNDLSDLGYRK